jgi:hypothetical protein
VEASNGNKGARKTYKKKARPASHGGDLVNTFPEESRKRSLEEDVEEELGESKRSRRTEQELVASADNVKAGLPEQP